MVTTHGHESVTSLVMNRWNEEVKGFPTMHYQAPNLFIPKSYGHKRDFGDSANSDSFRKRNGTQRPSLLSLYPQNHVYGTNVGNNFWAMN